MKETVEENRKTTEDVFQDRQYQIDAWYNTPAIRDDVPALS